MSNLQLLVLLARAAGGKPSPRSISKASTVWPHCECSRRLYSTTGTQRHRNR